MTNYTDTIPHLNIEVLPNGLIRLENESMSDSYVVDLHGRTVARVSCGGQDVSVHQVRAGLAWFYVKYGRDDAVKRGEAWARTAKAGLWADAGPVAPWEFRRSD